MQVTLLLLYFTKYMCVNETSRFTIASFLSDLAWGVRDCSALHIIPITVEPGRLRQEAGGKVGLLGI